MWVSMNQADTEAMSVRPVARKNASGGALPQTQMHRTVTLSRVGDPGVLPPFF